MTRSFRNAILLITLLIGTINTYAQQSIIIGQIYDSDSHEAIPGATVVIYDGEKSLVGALADIEGKFTLKIDQNSQKYTLSVSALGYQENRQTILADKPQIELGTLPCWMIP